MKPWLVRLLPLVIVGTLIALPITVSARTAVQQHTLQRKQAERQLHRLREQHRRTVRGLTRERLHARAILDVGGRVDIERRTGIRRWAARELHRTGRELRHAARSHRRRTLRLQRARAAHAAWLARYAVFEVCPVPGYTVIHNDFGEIVRMPGVPAHVHTGSDVQAPTGARIVAPFDGFAVASSSELGGLQVRVYGARGYVYNAHLSAFGQLGYVGAGTTVGYVGSTGNSTAPHDHIEWHPGDGGAVDPYLYLALSCFS